MKAKLKILVPLLLVAAGVGYKTVLAKPPVVKSKVDGLVYVLPKEFLVNLAEGRFAKVSVALVVSPHQALAPSSKEAPKPPDGFGPLEQEAVIRDIITNSLTGRGADDLISARGRQRLKQRIATLINRKTDVTVEEVLFTDVAVQ